VISLVLPVIREGEWNPEFGGGTAVGAPPAGGAGVCAASGPPIVTAASARAAIQFGRVKAYPSSSSSDFLKGLKSASLRLGRYAIIAHWSKGEAGSPRGVVN